MKPDYKITRRIDSEELIKLNTGVDSFMSPGCLGDDRITLLYLCTEYHSLYD